MNERQETTLFVASPDGKAMEPLPRSELRRRLQARLLRWTQQIWCAEEEKWKAAREIPRLGPEPAGDAKASASPPLAPRVVATKRPSEVQVATTPRDGAPPTPKARVAGKPSVVRTTSPAATAPGGTPAVRVPSVVAKGAPTSQTSAAPSRAAPSPELASVEAWHRRNSIFYGAGCLLILLALLGMNWLGAALPARKAVADAGLEGQAVVAAHCNYYVQPGSLILDFVRLPADLSSERFIDLLTALAKRNPTSTLFWAKYDSVAFVKGGTVRYRLRGDAWEALSRMKGEPAGFRAMTIVNYLYDANGKAILDQKEDRMEFLHGQKEKALRDFLGSFIHLETVARPKAASSAEPSDVPSAPAP